MKFLVIITLIFLTACAEEEKLVVSHKSINLTVKTYRKGIRVYSEKNQPLGYSPVVLDVEVKIVEDSLSKIKRYFIKGEEVHPGEKWPLRLKIYREGFLELRVLRVPFEPGQWVQTVMAEKKSDE